MWLSALLLALSVALVECSCPTDLHGLTGNVVTRTDAGYPSARLNRVNQDGTPPEPCLVVFVTSAQDVVNAMLWVRKNNVKFRVRAGRHDYNALSNLDDGLVIDMSRMRRAVVDEAKGTGSFDPGLDMFTVYEIVNRYGYAFPGGSCPTVGLGGFALGGGFGFLSRKYGVASDLLLGAEVVTADGDIVYASKDENEDLFWALRGGGHGNFGVVTKLDFQLVPKPSKVVIETITFPGMHKAKAVQFFFKWQKYQVGWPDELTSAFQWFPGSVQGTVDAKVVAVYLGDQPDLDMLLAPLTKIRAQFQTTAKTFDFLDAMIYLADCSDRSDCITKSMTPVQSGDVNKSTYRSRYVSSKKPLSKKDIGIIVDWIGNIPRDNGIGGMLWVDSYGGAISRVEPSQTAFPHRNMLYIAQFIGSWATEEQRAQVNEWINGFYGEIIPHMSRSAYINYGDLTLPHPLETYYGGNLERLKEVKGVWDPLNIFTHELSIPVPVPN